MSTRAQMRAALKRRIPRSDLVDDDYDKYLDDGILDLCTKRVWLRSLEHQGATITTSIGVSQYTIESVFFSITYIEDVTNKRRLERFDGGFSEYIEAKQYAQNGKPTRFVEFGPNFYVLDPPDSDAYSLIPYGYKRPAIGSGPTGMPNIEPEWHYPIELVAASHIFRDLGDEERAGGAEAEFDKWLSMRDTPIRHANRHDTPVRNIRIHGAYHNKRTGV